MNTYRVDTGFDYHTQRNNKIRPMGTCASTSMAMALNYAGWGSKLQSFVDPKNQEEDYITAFIHSNPLVLDYWEHHPYRWIRDTYTNYKKYTEGLLEVKHVIFGNEIGEIMCFAINTMMGKMACSYSHTMPLQALMKNIMAGGSATLSGVFPYKDKTIGHIVCMAGFTTSQEGLELLNDKEVDITKVDHFIIDDPFGDYHTNYESTKGNDIILPLEDIYSKLNELGNTLVKRAILVKKFF